MTGTTKSQHTANNMTVAIDWAALGKMSVTLKATVSHAEGYCQHARRSNVTLADTGRDSPHRSDGKGPHRLRPSLSRHD